MASVAARADEGARVVGKCSFATAQARARSERLVGGFGALAALQSPVDGAGSARAWVAAGALSDALDVVASVKSWPELPRFTRWLVAASAGGAALVGLAGALVADRAEPDRDSTSS